LEILVVSMEVNCLDRNQTFKQHLEVITSLLNGMIGADDLQKATRRLQDYVLLSQTKKLGGKFGTKFYLALERMKAPPHPVSTTTISVTQKDLRFIKKILEIFDKKCKLHSAPKNRDAIILTVQLALEILQGIVALAKDYNDGLQKLITGRASADKLRKQCKKLCQILTFTEWFSYSNISAELCKTLSEDFTTAVVDAAREKFQDRPRLPAYEERPVKKPRYKIKLPEKVEQKISSIPGLTDDEREAKREAAKDRLRRQREAQLVEFTEASASETEPETETEEGASQMNGVGRDEIASAENYLMPEHENDNLEGLGAAFLCRKWVRLLSQAIKAPTTLGLDGRPGWLTSLEVEYLEAFMPKDGTSFRWTDVVRSLCPDTADAVIKAMLKWDYAVFKRVFISSKAKPHCESLVAALLFEASADGDNVSYTDNNYGNWLLIAVLR
jgi:hypothetical protein